MAVSQVGVRVRARDRTRSRYSIDLPAHMAECDANYLRIEKLFPNLIEDDSVVFGLTLGERRLEVKIEVLERSPYTTFLELTQRDPDASVQLEFAKPRLKVRMYHDAKSAEVIEYQNQRRFKAVYDYPNRVMRQRDEKAQLNRFLGEFLAACLAHGQAIDQGAVATQN